MPPSGTYINDIDSMQVVVFCIIHCITSVSVHHMHFNELLLMLLVFFREANSTGLNVSVTNADDDGDGDDVDVAVIQNKLDSVL